MAQTARFPGCFQDIFCSKFQGFWGVLFIPRCERFFPETNCVTLARVWRSEPIGIGSSCAGWISRDGSEAMDQQRLGSLGYNLNIPAFVGYKLGTTPPSQHFSQNLGWVFFGKPLRSLWRKNRHINLGPPLHFFGFLSVGQASRLNLLPRRRRFWELVVFFHQIRWFRYPKWFRILTDIICCMDVTRINEEEKNTMPKTASSMNKVQNNSILSYLKWEWDGSKLLRSTRS